MNEIITRLESLKQKWTSYSESLPDDLKEWDLKYISKDNIAYVFDEIISLSRIIQQKGWQAPVALAVTDAQPNIDSIDSYMSSIVDPAEAQKKFDNFLWDLHTILTNYRNASTYSSDRVYSAEAQLSSLIGQIEKAEPALRQLQEVLSTMQTFQNESKVAQDNSAAIADLLSQAQQISVNISPVEAQVREHLLSVEKNSSTIAKYTGDISELKSQYVELYDNLEGKKEALKDILDTSTKQQEYIQQTIDDVSRAGLAGSFKKRKDELIKPMYLWGALFLTGVIGLFVIGFKEILPLLVKNEIDWIQLVGRITIVAPWVWLSWFSVKQYGHTVRLWEDYSFKYASAMAFDGYKKSAANVSEDMERLLMEVSIINFASNPLRVFDSKTNHGSPLNEFTDQSKGMIQDLFSKKKSG